MRRYLVVSVAAAAGAGAALSADPLGFFGSRVYLVGSALADVELADLDGDGALDIVTVRNGDQYACAVQWGDGDGGFGAPVTVATGYALESLVADVDGDGDLDVVRWGGAPDIVENLGGRTFAKRKVAEELLFWRVAAAEDFDGDGDLDLAGIGQSNEFWFAENDGAGVFTAHRLVAPAYQSGQVHDWMDSGDVDGDGDADLAVAYRNTGAVRILLGDGAGDFAETAPLSLGGNVTHVVVRDLDGDGDEDVAAAGTRLSPPAATPWHVVTFRQTEDGALEPWTTTDLAAAAADLDAADVDGDAFTDLVATTTKFEILLSDGQTLVAAGAFPSAAAYPTRCAVGDVDGDGRADLVNASYPQVGVLLQSSLPPPRPTSVSPAVIREPATVDLEFRGSGFVVGATVLAPADLAVSSVVRVSDDVLTARLAVPGHVGAGDRTLTVRNPDGKTSPATVTLTSLDVAAVSGVLRDARKGRQDRLRVAGTLAFNGLAVAPAFAAPLHDLTVRAGDPAAPLEFTVPAGDPRWRYVRGKQVWRSRSHDSPRAEVTIDNEQGTIEVEISRFAFSSAPTGTVRLEVVVGTEDPAFDRGAEDRAWTPGRRRGTFLLRP